MEPIVRALVAQFGLPLPEGRFGSDFVEWAPAPRDPDVRVLADASGRVEIWDDLRPVEILLVVRPWPSTLARLRIAARDGTPCISPANLAARVAEAVARVRSDGIAVRVPGLTASAEFGR